MAYTRTGGRRGTGLPSSSAALPPYRDAASALSPRERQTRVNQSGGFEWAMSRVMDVLRSAATPTPAESPMAGMAPPSLGGFSDPSMGFNLGQETDPFMAETEADVATISGEGVRSPIDTRRGDVADIEAEVTSHAEEIKATDDLLMSGKLTPESQAELIRRRNAIAEGLDDLEKQLRETKAQLQVQDLLFNFELESQGIDFDVAPLEEALTLEGGLGEQTFEAIKDITGNSALTPEEQGQALDAIVNRSKFSDELVRTVHDLVSNQQTLEELEGRSDVELLGDQAKFFDPPFKNIVEIDDAKRWDDNFMDIMAEGLPEVTLETDEQWEQLDNVINMMTTLGPDHLNTQNAIKFMADEWGEPYNKVRATLLDARDNADKDQQDLELALDSKNITPGSRSMAYAIMEAGRRAETPMPDEYLMLVANNTDLHMLIDVMSGGKSGRHSKDGTTAGVGGLTEEMYQYLMGEPWSEDKGMLWELEALIHYIFGAFGGDPMEAVNYYRKTGDWGGVYSTSSYVEDPFEEAEVE